MAPRALPTWFPLDPPLAGPLGAALGQVAGELEPGRVVELPALSGLRRVDVVRWLYRAWIAAFPGTGPLLHLDAARGGEPARFPELTSLAGWLFLDGARADPRPRQVTIVAGTGPTLDVPPEAAERILALDAAHLVATDPALADLRRSLLSHCRSASVLHLTGPPGVETVALARWAHDTLDDRPMSHLRRGGTRRPTPGEWELYEEPAELEPDQLHHLRRRLDVSARPAHAPAPAGGPRPDGPAFAPILGQSASLAAVLARAERAAPGPLSVLILGESGTGKESLARAIHDASGRKGPYHVADLNTLHEELIESELFGHRRGAFTGAAGDRLGAFRSADGGTLFLDELGNLSPRVQAKLLRALQEKVVQPVGDDRAYRVDVRIVAATNADLDAMVRRGDFREDLLRRLEAVTLRLPPLRDRGDDVLLLARVFAARAGATAEPWITPEARAILLRHDWPGNVRELGNVVAQAIAEAGGRPVEPADLGPLAPVNRRPVPVFATTTEGESDQPAGLDRPMVQRLRAVTLRLPALRDRGVASVRASILALLDGRPVRADALALLSARPWWGNLPELEADLAAVRANVPGVVDLPSLRRLLPHLLVGASAEPLHVLLHPVVQADRRVTGLRAEHHASALVVGRAGSRAELGAREEDLPRLRQLDTLLGGQRPAWLALPWFPRLSRAHAVVTRAPEGLVVHVLAGARHALKVTALASGTSTVVVPGGDAVIGPAGELTLDTEEGPPMQVFVFAGSVAFEELALAAAGRVVTTGGATLAVEEAPPLPPSGGRAPRSAQPDPAHADPPWRAGEPPSRGGDPPASAPRPPVPKSGVFLLEEAEVRALVDLVARYRGGSFHEHLVAGLADLGDEPTLARLVAYVLGPRPTQYCARLFEHEGNGGLRDALAQALDALPDGAARRAALPLGIRRSLG